MKEGLKGVKINRNIVVRRGVKGMNTLIKMLNLRINKDDRWDLDKLKDAIKKKIEQRQGKPLILKDPGFTSTSMIPDHQYLPDYADGVEFIINVKKGTQAVNITKLSDYKDENELLLNAGTKFRLVKIYYNGCENEEQRPLTYEQMDPNHKQHTHGRIWKVYMETIPSNEEGQLK